MGETSQTLRGRFNNHRNRLKKLCGLYIYQHFNSDSHTLEDMCIAPIEEVVLDHNDTMTLSSKRMQREEYWYRELCTVFPYGLNDNVKGIGNVSSKIGEGLVVYSLFNRHKRKYRKRSQKRHRKKVIEEEVNTKLQGILSTYKSVCFNNNFREYVSLGSRPPPFRARLNYAHAYAANIRRRGLEPRLGIRYEST